MVGTATPTPGVYASPPAPTSLPCLSGDVTLALHADGTDPQHLCAYIGTRITVHLPALSIGPWQPPAVTGDHSVTLTATQDTTGPTLHIAATAAGTVQISTQTNPGAAAGAPSQTWRTTLVVIP